MTVDIMDIVRMIRSGDKIGIQIYLRKGGDPNARNQMCWTLLHLASFEGQAEIAEILIEGGASVNSCTTDMSTPLHRGCAQGNRKVVELLVKKGAYINAQDKNGNTPLHEAARGFHTLVVKVLIENKADKTRLNKKKQSFLNLIGQQLMPSVESGDSEVLQQWLEWGASPDTKGNLHWSILHHACARGQLNIASLLIERGADVNIEDSNKTTPLHSACFHGHSRIASLLIDSNANVNAQDQRGNTPLHSAVLGGHAELVNLLLERNCDTTIANKEGQYFTHLVNEFLVTAVDSSKVAQVVSLLKGRAAPNTRDPYGYTVLCQAAFKGDMLVAEALLDAGADPNLVDEAHGKTPLHYASVWGHLFIVKALLDKGASVNIKDNVGATPLHEAAREGFEDVMIVLIGRGCNINETDNEGNTPLHVAGKWGQAAAVELLLEKCAKDNIRNKNNLLYSDLALIRAVRTADKDHVMSGMAWGGDPNSRDKRGWTLLHHAVYKGVEEICELLLENGANINAVDNHDRTPLLLAAYRGNQQIMQILLDAGADINCQDWMGRTPLHWAAKEGSIDTVQMLLDHKANTTITNKEGHLYSSLLLKHLYFAVRHNDADKVVRLVMAGADQFAEVEGTGVNPREEAKRRGFYDILRQMAALVEKKPKHEEDKTVVLEDIYKLFEDGDFTTSEEDLRESEEEEEEEEEDEDRNESEEDDYAEESDAYWKMSNAYEVLSVKEAFGEEDCAWLKEFEEKPKVISAKELLEEEQAAFWDTWQEKQKVISAKEFFKEESNWWENKDEDDDKNSNEEKNEISSSDFNRDDECWWRDAQENLEKPKAVPAKEYFKEEEPWWISGKENKEEDEEEEEDEEGSPKEYYTHDAPWWKSECQNSKTVSAKEFFRDDSKPWWQQDKVLAKDFFEEEKPWWQEDSSEKIVSAKDYFKEEVPWWQKENEKVISAKEFFKDDELPWWYTEEMQPDKPEGLKKSLATVRYYERYLINKQMYEEKGECIEFESELSGDEIEESTRTDDYEDATDSLISNSSTMYSASEGDRPLTNTVSDHIPWRRSDKEGSIRKNIPKAEDFFQEKHWLDDASEASEPTEMLDMDMSEMSEIVTASEFSQSGSWNQDSDAKDREENETDEEEGESLEEEGESLEEEEGEDEEEDECEEDGEEEEEEEEEEERESGEEVCEEVSSGESEALRSEDEIDDISEEEPGSKSSFECIEAVLHGDRMGESQPSKTSEILTKECLSQQGNIPSIVLDDKELDKEILDKKSAGISEEFHSNLIIPKVVSNSYESLEKRTPNIDIEVTNHDFLTGSNHYSNSVHNTDGNLQKSDSQTSGYDSSLSFSDNKIRDLPNDSGNEHLCVDENAEDTDLSDTMNLVSSETTESIEESICLGEDDECDDVKKSVNDIQLAVKELKETGQQLTEQDVISQDNVTSVAKDQRITEMEDNKVFIHMAWDKGDNVNPCQTNLPEEPESQIIENVSILKTSHLSGQPPITADGNITSEDVQDNGKSTSMDEEVQTYASVVKRNLERRAINKMDDCLAKFDASLASVGAKLTKESSERNSNSSNQERMSDWKEQTYAAIVKQGNNLQNIDSKSILQDSPGNNMSFSEQKAKEERETNQLFKVHVHVPEKESEFPDLRTEKRCFSDMAEEIIRTKNTDAEGDPWKFRKYVTNLSKEHNLEVNDGITIPEKEAYTKMAKECGKINESENDLRKWSDTRTHINDKSVCEFDMKKEIENEDLCWVNTENTLKNNENVTESGKEKETDSLLDNQNLQQETPNESEKISGKAHFSENRELSRESSLERVPTNERGESPNIHVEKSLWRFSTYDPMSLSEYDNVAFMVKKDSNSPASWGNKKKRKECECNTSSPNQDFISHKDSENNVQQNLTSTHSKDTEDQYGDTTETINIGLSTEYINTGLSPENTNIELSSEKDIELSAEKFNIGISSGRRENDTKEYTAMTEDDTDVKKCSQSLNKIDDVLKHHDAPGAPSVLLLREDKILGAEACTNLSETSCNQDPSVAIHRNKESSLLCHKVKYNFDENSADTIPTSPHALYQPTNPTLYDPDKKETSKVEAAVNKKPDEPRLQPVPSKRSKEVNKKDKEKQKQKELAVATGKVDPVRKSSSCSVS